MTLEELRKQINEVDQKLVALLNERTRTAVEIGKIKESQGLEPYDPGREKKVLERVAGLNHGPLDSTSLKAIYREIMSSALAIEKQVKVAYLGPAATFSHGAARSRFGTSVEYMACETVADIFHAVETRTVNYGVVPVENSIQGPEAPTLDCFVNTTLKICAEIVYPISFCLMSRSPRERIKRIYSHPQGFGQCRRWLQMEMPGVEQIPTASTARAAELASVEKGAAALSSSLAAEIYKLDVVASSVHDVAGNETRFMVLSKTPVKASGNDKTSLIFGVRHTAGSLYKALEAFRKFKLNMTKIESRPSRSKAWEYYFFVDFEGHIDEPNVARALKALSAHCSLLTVLGSYPKAL
ncbi:MAG: prephenate dehydratase [bacterium]